MNYNKITRIEQFISKTNYFSNKYAFLEIRDKLQERYLLHPPSVAKQFENSQISQSVPV